MTAGERETSTQVAKASQWDAFAEEESIESIELSLMLEGLYRLYGYDFRDYSRSSLLRRVKEAVADEGLQTIAGLLERIVHDPDAGERLIVKLTVNVTSFFRNPEFFRAFREQVVPELADREFIRIWHAGCATGQEVYSAAIVLEEAGLLERTRIYATDLSRHVLHIARDGRYPAAELVAAEADYEDAGGIGSIAHHVTIGGGIGAFGTRFRERIVFAQHDLVRGGRFNQFDVIFSRNVLIYFNTSLQERAIRLYTESLTDGGFLGLGERESVLFSESAANYRPLAIPSEGEGQASDDARPADSGF
jgi:chemotaxis protein methyltransferase CheR